MLMHLLWQTKLVRSVSDFQEATACLKIHVSESKAKGLKRLPKVRPGVVSYLQKIFRENQLSLCRLTSDFGAIEEWVDKYERKINASDKIKNVHSFVHYLQCLYHLAKASKYPSLLPTP